MVSDWGPWLMALSAVALAGYSSGHAILRKRDVRAAIGWVGLIWLVPFAGSLLYAVFGINRIRRRASELRQQHPLAIPAPQPTPLPAPQGTPPVAIAETGRHLAPIGALLDRISPMPRVGGNSISALIGGESTYFAMAHAIDAAETSVGMATYIFDNDAAGRILADALNRAAARGVIVRVLVDGVGSRYGFSSLAKALRRRGVVVAEFLPTSVPVYLPYANLRNHRKILVVDGRVGFTGGMNVRQGFLYRPGNAYPDQDTHFRLDGPVVAHLTQVITDDWAFATGERLEGEAWFPAIDVAGDTLARGIASGPDENFELIRWTILAAISQAKHRIRVVTPYFLPDPIITATLVTAAMRGVAIDILMPERSNHRLIQWASWTKLGELIIRGCRIWLSPPPFDHSKLMTVDGAWAMIGSANWDQRSLRLNFEFNVECHDETVTRDIDGLIDGKLAIGREVRFDDVNGRPLAIKLRDGTAWLLSPYL